MRSSCARPGRSNSRLPSCAGIPRAFRMHLPHTVDGRSILKVVQMCRIAHTIVDSQGALGLWRGPDSGPLLKVMGG